MTSFADKRTQATAACNTACARLRDAVHTQQLQLGAAAEAERLSTYLRRTDPAASAAAAQAAEDNRNRAAATGAAITALQNEVRATSEALDQIQDQALYGGMQ